MEIKVHLGKIDQVSVDGQILPTSALWIDNENEGHEELVLRIPMSHVAILEMEH